MQLTDSREEREIAPASASSSTKWNNCLRDLLGGFDGTSNIFKEHSAYILIPLFLIGTEYY